MANKPQPDMGQERNDRYYESQCPPRSKYPSLVPEVQSPRLRPQQSDEKVPTEGWDQLPDPAYVPYAEHYSCQKDQEYEQQDFPKQDRAFIRPRHDAGHDDHYDTNIDEVRIHRRLYNTNATKARSSQTSNSDHNRKQYRQARGMTRALLQDDRMIWPPANERGRLGNAERNQGSSFSASNSRYRSQHSRSRGRSHGARTQNDQVNRPRAKSNSLQNVKDHVQQEGGDEGLVTPLRLAMLLGAFEISLCVWMAHKRFGKGAKTQLAPDTAGEESGQRMRNVRRRHSSTPQRGRRREEPEHRREHESDTDSEDVERQRRAAAFVRERARFNVDRDRSM